MDYAAITSAPGDVEVDISPDGIIAAQQVARCITAISGH